MIQSQSLMMQNMSMMASSTMNHQQKEDKRKSMMSKIIREDEHLFTLLAAESWDESHPRICTFTRDLMADKDVHVAWAQIKRKIMEWPGLVSQKQMTKFLRSGFIAPDLDEAPGGFTLFMFRPTDFPPARSSKEEFNAMKALLGETKLDNDSIRFYAENEFFIAQSVGQLEDQLTMAAMTLQLFTRDYSIGLEGYEYLLRNIRRHRGKFERMFKADPLFGAKVGYRIDTIFQTFCLELTKFADERYPIEEARHDLKGYMEDEISDLVKEVRRGTVPSMILPPALSQSDPYDEVDEGKDSRKGKNPKGGAGTGKPDPKKYPTWFGTNPEPIEAWGLPTGKKFSDFFDTQNPEHKGNLEGWPKLPHHFQKDTVRPMCLHYQAQKRCKKGAKCYMAHANPVMMDAVPKKIAGEKFKEVYQ
jgi:hypothetical protein